MFILQVMSLKSVLVTSSNQKKDVLSQWVLKQEKFPELLIMLLLSCPECLYLNLQPDLLNQVRELRKLEKMPLLMRQEVNRLREQMSALHELCAI